MCFSRQKKRWERVCAFVCELYVKERASGCVSEWER